MHAEDHAALLQRIEHFAGCSLPHSYAEWLSAPRTEPPDSRLFDMAKLLETQRIVQAVLPAGSIAIAEDGYGNLFLMQCADGSVVWWFHELDEEGHNRVEPIADSFAAFLDELAKHPFPS